MSARRVSPRSNAITQKRTGFQKASCAFLLLSGNNIGLIRQKPATSTWLLRQSDAVRQQGLGFRFNDTKKDRLIKKLHTSTRLMHRSDATTQKGTGFQKASCAFLLSLNNNRGLVHQNEINFSRKTCKLVLKQLTSSSLRDGRNVWPSGSHLKTDMCVSRRIRMRVLLWERWLFRFSTEDTCFLQLKRLFAFFQPTSIFTAIPYP